MRRLGHALMSHDASSELLERVADAADRIAADLEAGPPRHRDLHELKRRMFDRSVGEGEHVVHFDECFVSGPWNPLGIAMEVHREGEEAVAEVTLGPAFEGAPGRSHGGIVAALFDDVLGYVLTLDGTPAFTGELTVRYHAPTPIGEPVALRARAVERQDRKIRMTAEATVEGEVVASAEGLFIVIPEDRIRP